MRAIVVLSGGQDSALCLALACRRFGAENVAAITFAYGQRHAVELKYARKLAKRFGILQHKVVKLDFYAALTDSSLLGNDAKSGSPSEGIRRIRRGFPEEDLPASHPAGCPSTVVEGRNAIFLQIASVWAKSLGAKCVYTGVSQTDYSGYPDCREAFIKAQQKSIRLALEYPITIITPFMYKTKADEWALADKLGLLEYINENTVTCYNGISGKGCGKCPACKLRNAGLKSYLNSNS